MIKALIIDDEKRALNVLRLLIEQHLPEIEEVHAALGSKQGLKLIDKINPDLLFLDVEMPGMTGFELLEQLGERKVNVIFTTAYDHYAIRAIRCSAVDYLMKPIDIQELKEAVQRFIHRSARDDEQNTPMLQNLISNLKSIHYRDPRLAVPTSGGLVFFNIDEIIYCQADQNYTSFYLSNGKEIVVSKTLKDYDELLSEYQFLRVHKSYLINPAYVDNYAQKGTIELQGGYRIPVSRRKHQWVQTRLKSIFRSL